MSDDKEKLCLCPEHQQKQDLADKYDALFNSLDNKTQEIVCELMNIHDLIGDPIMSDMKAIFAKLNAKYCNKVIISFEGVTAGGQKIKEKEKLAIYTNN